jgi:hypothetical protein
MGRPMVPEKTAHLQRFYQPVNAKHTRPYTERRRPAFKRSWKKASWPALKTAWAKDGRSLFCGKSTAHDRLIGTEIRGYSDRI